MARFDTLVQVSLSRLGDTCRNRSELHLSSRSGRSPCFERDIISLKRETLAYARTRESFGLVAPVLAQARNLTFGRGVVVLR